VKRRTDQERIAHHEDQARRAKLRLARAKDGRVMLVEETIDSLRTIAADLDIESSGKIGLTLEVLDAFLARLVAEASAT